MNPSPPLPPPSRFRITPGEILLEEKHRRLVGALDGAERSPKGEESVRGTPSHYLNPMGISQNAMARAIGVAPRAINEIVHAKRSTCPSKPRRRRITPAMSIRFGAFFGQPVHRSLGEVGSDTFWHGLQVECDFRALAKDRKKLTSSVKPATELTTIS